MSFAFIVCSFSYAMFSSEVLKNLFDLQFYFVILILCFFLAMFRAGAHTHQSARSKCNKAGAEQEQMYARIREIENEHSK